MEREHIIKAIMTANDCTENQARAAFTTYRNIKADGYEVTKANMTPRTFRHHRTLLLRAGISDQHLHEAVVLPFPRVRFTLAQPVTCWDDIRRAA